MENPQAQAKAKKQAAQERQERLEREDRERGQGKQQANNAVQSGWGSIGWF